MRSSPEFEPSWRFISEYAIGQHGWIMKLAFLIWAVSCAALALSVRRRVADRRGRTGCVILLVVAVAQVVAGLFPQDPVTIRPDEATTSGALHALASMVGIPGLPLAAILIGSSLSRVSRQPAITWSAHATWISLLLMAVYLMWAVPRAGGFTAEVWAGWMNRMVVATYLAWQFVVASHLVALRPAR